MGPFVLHRTPRPCIQTYYLFCIKNLLFFFILHTYFYNILTSVHLLYTIFYINNIFIFFFNIILSPISFSYSSSSFFFFLFPYFSLRFPISFSSSSFSHGQINIIIKTQNASPIHQFLSQTPQPSKPRNTDQNHDF